MFFGGNGTSCTISCPVCPVCVVCVGITCGFPVFESIGVTPVGRCRQSGLFVFVGVLSARICSAVTSGRSSGKAVHSTPCGLPVLVSIGAGCVVGVFPVTISVRDLNHSGLLVFIPSTCFMKSAADIPLCSDNCLNFSCCQAFTLSLFAISCSRIVAIVLFYQIARYIQLTLDE
jgi:hypothetical protein